MKPEEWQERKGSLGRAFWVRENDEWLREINAAAKCDQEMYKHSTPQVHRAQIVTVLENLVQQIGV